MVITGDAIKLNREISIIQKDIIQADYIFVIGNDGQLLAHTFERGFPPELFTANILPEDKSFSSRLLLAGKGRIRDFAIRTARHMPGEVHVGINEETYYKNIRSTLKTSIFIMIFSVLLGLLLAYVMSHYLVRPLKMFSVGMKRLGNGDMKFRLEEKGEITLMNKKGWETLGYNEGELNGRNWFDTCLPVRLRKEVKEVFSQLMSGDIEPFEHYDNPVLKKSGEERIIHWHNTVLRDGAGKITGALSSGEDILTGS